MIDQYKPRYLLQKQLLEEQRAANRQEKKDWIVVYSLLAFVFCIPIYFLIWKYIDTSYDLYSNSVTEIQRQIDAYNGNSDLAPGSDTVVITYSERADIHHIVKKLQRFGYQVSTTNTKGYYSAKKYFRVDSELFESEYDLYRYLKEKNQ